MTTKPCCFTGHRNIPPHLLPQLQKSLDREILGLIGRGVTCFRAGGAAGFDTLAARAVLALKSEFPHIHLELVLPHFGCTTDGDVLTSADSVTYCADTYFGGVFHLRNRRLVEGCGHCIAYLVKDKGGTAYTVKYAEEQGLTPLLLGLGDGTCEV